MLQIFCFLYYLIDITILLYFFFSLLLVFHNFFTSPIGNENVRLRLALAITTGVPLTVANNAIEILPFVADKTIKNFF